MSVTRLDISGRLSTGDINLAATLLTNGIPLDFSNPISKVKPDRGRDYVRFHFMPVSMDGKTKAGDVCAAWDAGMKRIRTLGKMEVANLPDDCTGHCMCAFNNLVALRDFVKNAIPQVLIRRGSSVVLIDENAGPRLQETILGKLS